MVKLGSIAPIPSMEASRVILAGFLCYPDSGTGVGHDVSRSRILQINLGYVDSSKKGPNFEHEYVEISLHIYWCLCIYVYIICQTNEFLVNDMVDIKKRQLYKVFALEKYFL